MYSLTQQMKDKKPCKECGLRTFIFADQRCAVCTDAADWSKGASAYISDLLFLDRRTKVCNECRIERGIDQFYADHSVEHGNGYRSSCKICYDKRKNEKRRAARND